MNENKQTRKIDASRKLGDISELKSLPAAPFDTEATSKQIEEILKKYDMGLITYPSLQRNGVWSVKDQSELIESLIRGIPIPPLYMNKCRTKDGQEQWEVLDGRQRITALIDFFKMNTVKINKNLPEDYEALENYRYKDIIENNPLFAGKFTSLRLPVVWMNNAPEQLKKEFFQKLNKGGKALTPGELAHSSLDPANEYMVMLMGTQFYEVHVNKTQRYAEYVPASKVLHFILQSMQQKTKTFEYNPGGLNGWKDRIITNSNHIQTDLDNLHELRNEAFVPYLKEELNRICTLVDNILGDVEIESSNNKLIVNMLISLLILEDKTNSHAMGHDELKQAFEGLVKLWNKGHVPTLRNKVKTQLANITSEESLLINECDKLESSSKTSLADVLENIRNDAYSNYA